MNIALWFEFRFPIVCFVFVLAFCMLCFWGVSSTRGTFFFLAFVVSVYVSSVLAVRLTDTTKQQHLFNCPLSGLPR